MKKAGFTISHTLIWVSSLFLGVLSSIPQLAAHDFNAAEAIVNAGITAAFAVVMWYVNLYMLSRKPANQNRSAHHQPIQRHPIQSHQRSISYTRLLSTLGIGILVMLGLAWLQQIILSHISFGPTMLMVEVRGILINLVFYLFLSLLQHNYENQHVNIQLEQIRHDNLGAQYELLKQQVNPHFLFNSLNTLKAMVEGEEKEAADFIVKLSNFYRFTLESRKQDLIKLSEEMEILDAYFFLQKARFDAALIFTSTLSETTLNTFIPPFTLQLLAENCIKHNEVSLKKPLHIKLYEEDDHIVIENPVQLKKGETDSLGVGLSNIELRYSHLEDKQINIVGDGASFAVKLPIIHQYHH